MRRFGVAAIVGLIALPLLLAPAAALPDDDADVLVGQPSFMDTACNAGGISGASLCEPRGISVDRDGNVYVADTANNRVLMYERPLISDSVADMAIGQPDMTSSACNNGGLSASSLCMPYSVDLDADGNLYIADFGNSRVLEYHDPLTTDAEADTVFGQPDMVSDACNNGGIDAATLCLPGSVSVDDVGNVYIADTGNSRVLGYIQPFIFGTVADRVFGQAGSYTSGACNNGGVSATSLCLPESASFHGFQHLFITDTANSRVLLVDNPLASPLADYVIGQPDFATAGCNTGGLPSALNLCEPRGVAIDHEMNTYVADSSNHRVLQYNDPIMTDSTADLVYGQAGSFSTATCHNGGASATSLCAPHGLAVDETGNLFAVEDAGYPMSGDNSNRGLVYFRCEGQPDCDAVPSGSDNCPLATNPGQENNDGNFVDNDPYATDDRTWIRSDQVATPATMTTTTTASPMRPRPPDRLVVFLPIRWITTRMAIATRTGGSACSARIPTVQCLRRPLRHAARRLTPTATVSSPASRPASTTPPT
jgi:sugar lactone lactonase YvrE